MEVIQLSPRRPYLLRAFYEWLLNNQLTPYLVADVTLNGVTVPIEFSRAGKIVLNISPSAVVNLELGNEKVQFNSSFDGIPKHVILPMAAILAIYAHENGSGVMFEPELAYEQQKSSEISLSGNSNDNLDNDNNAKNRLSRTRTGSGYKPTLRVVK